jgi:DNA invertase Pin-like site-specific DNA recombinase
MREGLSGASLIGRQTGQLEAALDYVREREGDSLVVTKLDRLARSVGDLLNSVAFRAAQLIDVPKAITG